MYVGRHERAGVRNPPWGQAPRLNLCPKILGDVEVDESAWGKMIDSIEWQALTLSWFGAANDSLTKDALQLFDQRRKVALNDRPQNVEVDDIVSMNDPMACSNDLGPRDFLSGSTPVLTHAARGFTDDLNEPDQRQVQHAILIEITTVPATGHLDRFAGVVLHVTQPHGVIMPRHTRPLLRQAPRA